MQMLECYVVIIITTYLPRPHDPSSDWKQCSALAGALEKKGQLSAARI